MRKLYTLILTLLISLATKAQSPATIVADKDNTIYSVTTANSNGAGQYFFVGKNTGNNGGSIQRALLHFNLNTLPANAFITSATLTVYVNKSGGTASGLELHKMTSDWGEGTSDASGNEGPGVAATNNDATWTHRIFPATQWATAGGDFSSSVSAFVQSVDAGIRTATAVSLSGPNLVTDVQGWLADPSTNFGWAIKSNNEVLEGTAKRFISKNSTATTQRPTLTVTYSVVTPVTLKQFSASPVSNDVLLKWVTATEVDNEYFEVEHSVNGRDFNPVAQVKGNGTSGVEHTYSYLHKNVGGGKHFYRIADNNRNGNKRFSQILVLSSDATLKLQLLPNPATSYITVSASSLIGGNEFTINALSGQVVMKGKLSEKRINIQNLASGQYWLIIKTGVGEFLKAQFLKN